MKQRTRVLLVLVCAVAILAWEANARSSNVVYFEPELSDAYVDQIHPYAWSHRLPLPHYTDKQTPYSPVKQFDPFVDLQSQVAAQSSLAKKMTHTPALLETSTFATFTTTAHAASKALTKDTEQLEDNRRFIFSAGLGLGLGKKKGDPNNPASTKPMKLKRNRSPFTTALNQEVSTGFKNSFRRAVYGLRRRRMPFTGNAEMLTLNPFRRPNNYVNTPADLLFPRQRFQMAKSPSAFDFGRFGDPAASAYGHFSSFSDPKIRHSMGPTMAGSSFLPPNVGAIGDSFVPYPNNRWDGEKFAPRFSPFVGGVSPYIPGNTYKFYDFYGSSGGAAGAASGASAASGQASAA